MLKKEKIITILVLFTIIFSFPSYSTIDLEDSQLKAIAPFGQTPSYKPTPLPDSEETQKIKELLTTSLETPKSKGYIIKFKEEPLLVTKKELEDEIKLKEKEAEEFQIMGMVSNYNMQLQEINQLKQSLPIKINNKRNDIIIEHTNAKIDIAQKINKQLAGITASANSISVMGEYHGVFNGIALGISEEEAKEIKKLEYVEEVYPNYEIQAMLMDSIPLIGADQVWQLDEDGNDCLTSGKQCLTGQDITIAVIDTGVDYTHPDLGACTTEEFLSGNCEKVIGGYDFVNDDNDPMDDHGHGTHCAATAAGDDTLKGVAPGAKVYAYKALSDLCIGFTSEIIQAIERSVDPNQDGDFSDHVDIISMSIGGPGAPDDAKSQAVDNAVDSDVVVVVAAGNSGPGGNLNCRSGDDGSKSICSPGTARKAITVGASYNNNNFYLDSIKYDLEVDGIDRPIHTGKIINNKDQQTSVTGEIEYVGLGTIEDFASNDLSNEIALIMRGNIPLAEKVENAYNAGAIGVVIFDYESQNPLSFILPEESAIPVTTIGRPDGDSIIEQIESEQIITATLTRNHDPIPEIAEFSSRGPLNNNILKPDITAPGIYICAARHSYAWSGRECLDDEHVLLSGTSMATPHVAGAAALLKQKNPDLTPLEIKTILRETAINLEYDYESQGRGQIDTVNAISNSDERPLVPILDTFGGFYIQSLVDVKGTILGDVSRFQNYKIEYAEEDSLTDWNLVHQSSTFPVDGLLFEGWDLSEPFPSASIWNHLSLYLKLSVEDISGFISSDIQKIDLMPVYINKPIENSIYHQTFIPIEGNIAPAILFTRWVSVEEGNIICEIPFQSYSVYVKPEGESGYVLLVESDTLPSDSNLGVFDASELEDGTHELRIEVDYQGMCADSNYDLPQTKDLIINVIRTELSSPDPYYLTDVDDNLVIKGTISGEDLIDYSLYLGEGYDPQSWELILFGSQEIVEALITEVDFSSKPNGIYVIRLGVHYNNRNVEKYYPFVKKWPKVFHYGIHGTSVEDLTYNENYLIKGTGGRLYVLDHNGKNHFPSIPVGGQATPAIADVDNSYKKEYLISGPESKSLNLFDSGFNPIRNIWPKDKPNIIIDPDNDHIWSSYIPTSIPPVLEDLDWDGQSEIVLVVQRGMLDGTAENDLHVLDINGDPLPGWPKTLAANDLRRISIGDMDNDGIKEIFIGQQIGMSDILGIEAYRLNGDELFPSLSLDCHPGIITLADMTNDGYKEAVFLCSDRTVKILDHNGNIISSWDNDFGGGDISHYFQQPLVSDFDNNGNLEVLYRDADGNLYLTDMHGNLFSENWPRFISESTSIPLIVDVDEDGYMDIIISAVDAPDLPGSIFVIDRFGDDVIGWPREIDMPHYLSIGYVYSEYVQASPLVFDIDHDDRLELFFHTYYGLLGRIDLDTSSNPANIGWGMGAYNQKRTNCFKCHYHPADLDYDSEISPTELIASSNQFIDETAPLQFLFSTIRFWAMISCDDADFDGDRDIDGDDLEIFEANFERDDCNFGNDFCDGTDIDKNGEVDVGDFSYFTSCYQA